MKYEFLSPGKGKSRKAIMQAAMTDAYIICCHRQDAIRLMKEAEELNLPIRFPITIDEYLRDRMMGSRVRNIVIDDLDRMLPALFPNLKIEMITMSVNLERDEVRR